MRRAHLAVFAGLAALTVAWLGGCATAASRMDRLAAESGLGLLTLPAGEFRLRAYGQRLPAGPMQVLHVYLEGDGRPWVADGSRVARAPHGAQQLAFDLMRLDPAPSLYLKRPCYQGLANEGPCHPLLWTHQRYSETVVATMETSMRGFLRDHPASEIVWIGYSGGGVLAMLLAPRFEESTDVVTVAANLDVAAWAELHRYTPLTGSLDPARQPPLASRIRQLHLAGELDRNVPPSLVRGATAAQPAAEVKVLEGFGHTCCWTGLWPKILEGLVRRP